MPADAPEYCSGLAARKRLGCTSHVLFRHVILGYIKARVVGGSTIQFNRSDVERLATEGPPTRTVDLGSAVA